MSQICLLYTSYQDGTNLYAAQYFDSTAHFSIGSTNVTLIQKQDSLSGSFHISSTSSAEQAIHENTQRYPIQPDCMAICMRIEMDSPCADFSLKLRIPDWACARTDSYAGNPAVFQDVCFELNGKQLPVDAKDGFLTIQRNWQNGDELRLILPLCKMCIRDRCQADIQVVPIVYSWSESSASISHFHSG